MDINQTYYGDYFTIYTNIKSLSCTPEINIMYVNYTSVIKMRPKEQQWETSTTYQNGQTPEHWKRQMQMRMWSNRGSHALLLGMQTGTTTLENSFRFLTKHTLLWSSNHAPWYWFKWVENICSHKNLYTNVYSSFIYDNQNLEANKMSFSRWIDE